MAWGSSTRHSWLRRRRWELSASFAGSRRACRASISRYTSCGFRATKRRPRRRQAQHRRARLHDRQPQLPAGGRGQSLRIPDDRRDCGGSELRPIGRALEGERRSYRVPDFADGRLSGDGWRRVSRGARSPSTASEFQGSAWRRTRRPPRSASPRIPGLRGRSSTSGRR